MRRWSFYYYTRSRVADRAVEAATEPDRRRRRSEHLPLWRLVSPRSHNAYYASNAPDRQPPTIAQLSLSDTASAAQDALHSRVDDAPPFARRRSSPSLCGRRWDTTRDTPAPAGEAPKSAERTRRSDAAAGGSENRPTPCFAAWPRRSSCRRGSRADPPPILCCRPDAPTKRTTSEAATRGRSPRGEQSAIVAACAACAACVASRPPRLVGGIIPPVGNAGGGCGRRAPRIGTAPCSPRALASLRAARRCPAASARGPRWQRGAAREVGLPLEWWAGPLSSRARVDDLRWWRLRRRRCSRSAGGRGRCCSWS